MLISGFCMRKRALVATVAIVHLIKLRKLFESFLVEFSCLGVLVRVDCGSERR